MSLPSCITLRTVKGSVLSWSELDTNFICLNNSIESLSNLAHNGNMWHIPAGYTLTIESDYQHFIYGNLLVEGLIQLSGDSQLVILNGDLILSGGSIDGTGTVYNIDLPIFDTKITGLTYSNGVITIQQNNGIDFSASTPTSIFTGNTSGDCITDLYVTNLNSCSPLNIQPNSNGNVLIGQNGGVNVGIGTNNPLYKLDVNGGGRFSGNSLTLTPLSLNGTNSFGSSIGLFQTDVSMNRNSLAFVGTTSTAMGLGVNFNSGIPEKVYISNMSGNDIFHFMENGCMGIGVFNPSESLEVSGKTKTSMLQITSPYVPTGSADTNGSVGDVSWDETYFYWKTSTNGWLRTSGQTW